MFVPFLIADVYTGLFGLFSLFKKESELLFCVNMNRGKLSFVLFFSAFLLFAFGDYVNLFAGGSCSYTVDEGAEDGGECCYSRPCSPQQSESLPRRRLLFSLTVVRYVACCQQAATLLQLKVERQKVECFRFSGRQRATFVLLLAFFLTTWNSLFSPQQRLSKETALLGLSLKKKKPYPLH